MQKLIRREKAAVAIAALLELSDSRVNEHPSVTPWENLPEEDQEYARNLSENLINLVDALRDRGA